MFGSNIISSLGTVTFEILIKHLPLHLERHAATSSVPLRRCSPLN